MLWLWLVYYVLLSLSGYFKLEWQSILLLLGWYVFFGGEVVRERKEWRARVDPGKKRKVNFFGLVHLGAKRGHLLSTLKHNFIRMPAVCA